MRISRVLLHVTRVTWIPVTQRGPRDTCHKTCQIIVHFWTLNNSGLMFWRRIAKRRSILRQKSKGKIWFIFEYIWNCICKKLVGSNDVYSVKLTCRPHSGAQATPRPALSHRRPDWAQQRSQLRRFQHHRKEEKSKRPYDELRYWDWLGFASFVSSLKTVKVLCFVINHPVKSFAKSLHLLLIRAGSNNYWK